jgi:hypothetical protein
MSIELHAVRVLLMAVTALPGLPAFAHHSPTMFDQQKEVTLAGTVKEFQFTNPHCFIQLLVTKDGDVEEWSIEMGSPAHLIRTGWKPNTLKAGEKITAIINPLREGKSGGNYVSATRADGRPVGARP